MKSSFIFIAFITICNATFSQNSSAVLDWARTSGGILSDIAVDIELDTDDNVFVAGTFKDTVDFDPTSNTDIHVSNGGTDIFITKYDQLGNYLWTITIGNIGNDNTRAIEITHSGEVLLLGDFFVTLDVDPSASVTNLVSLMYEDVFFAKYTTNGDFVWGKSISGSYQDFGYDIVVDEVDNIHITGEFRGTIDFDPSSNTESVVATFKSAIVAKYTEVGNFVWVRKISSTSDVTGVKLIVKNNEVIVAGKFKSTVDLNPSPTATQTVASANNSWDIFIDKLDANGDFIWGITFRGNFDEEIGDLALDGENNILLTGLFGMTCDFDPGVDVFNLQTGSYQGNSFISKINPDGTFDWAKQLNAGSSGVGTFADPKNQGFGIDVDTTDNVYITGFFHHYPTVPIATDFDPGIGVVNIIPNNGIDSYILKLDSLGNYVWVKTLGIGGTQVGKSLKLGATGGIYTTGYFTGTIDVDPSNVTESYTTTGVEDFYIHKMNSCDLPVAPQLVTDSLDLLGCYNQSILLEASGMGNLNWYTNTLAQVIIGQGDFFLAENLIGDTTFYVSDSNYCGIGASIAIDLTIIPLIQSTQTITICPNSSFTIGNSVYEVEGNYSDTLIALNGCDSIVQTQLSFYTVDASISQNGTNLSANNSNIAFQWIDCGSGLNLGETSPNYTMTQNGSYAVIATSTEGCIDTSNCIEITTIGLNEIETQSLKAIPNPFTDKVALIGVTGTIEIKVYNTSGLLITQQITDDHNISLELIPAGSYILEVKSTELNEKIHLVKIN